MTTLRPDAGAGADAGAGEPARPAPSLRPALALLALAALVAASFASLDLQWAALVAPDSAQRMREFLAGFVPPEHAPAFLRRIGTGAAETLAMSALGTLLAAVAALPLGWAAALAARATAPPARMPPARTRRAVALDAVALDATALRALRGAARLLLNVMRAVPELVWAALLLIAAGLGPLPGTLALAVHTTGVLGRLFAETFENLPAAPARALRDNGASGGAVFFYAVLPQALAQLISYTLYRWENNIRAAAVLGVVGAGGLGQMLYYHLGLFQMREAATVILAMIAIVVAVDAASWSARRRLAG